MLVLLTQDQVLSPGQVCCSCIFASQSGQPRWRDGHLACGRLKKQVASESTQQRCPMGFRVVDVP